MKDKLNIFFKLQSQVYRIVLFLLSVSLIVYLIPKKGKFQYDFKEGKPWKYETLISPFDFLIQKSESEINFEKLLISKNAIKYFTKDSNVSDSIISLVNVKFNDSFPNLSQQAQQAKLKSAGKAAEPAQAQGAAHVGDQPPTPNRAHRTNNDPNASASRRGWPWVVSG